MTLGQDDYTSIDYKSGCRLIVMMIQQLRLVELGNAIRAFRLKAKLTQQELAERSGFDATYISMLERGRRNPPFLTLCSIGRQLGVPLYKLLKEFKDH